MKKFLLCVGAEKAGTTWLHRYFRAHTEYIDLGKELNFIQRDDLVPDLEGYKEFRSNIFDFFDYVANLNVVTGDFTHYEGSTENIFRLYKDEFEKRGIEVVPVYIMRDPIRRAWSAWNMLGGGRSKLSKAPMFLVKNHLACKYKETVQALDNVFDKPMYFFYEEFFQQENLNAICERLDITSKEADCSKLVNQGYYKKTIPNSFIKQFGLSKKNLEAVKFIAERFDNVPWNLEDYKV